MIFLSLERVTYHRFTLRLRTVNTQAAGRRKWRWMIARLVVGMGREVRVTTWSRRSKDIRSIVVVLLFLLALFSAPVVQNVYVYTCICIYICMYVWNQISPYSLLDRNWQVKPQIRTFTFHTSVRLSFGSVILFPSNDKINDKLSSSHTGDDDCLFLNVDYKYVIVMFPDEPNPSWTFCVALFVHISFYLFLDILRSTWEGVPDVQISHA